MLIVGIKRKLAKSVALVYTIATASGSDREIILVGELTQASNIQLITHVIILLKKFQYENCQNTGKIDLISFQYYLAMIQVTEEKIAKNNDKTTHHQ